MNGHLHLTVVDQKPPASLCNLVFYLLSRVVFLLFCLSMPLQLSCNVKLNYFLNYDFTLKRENFFLADFYLFKAREISEGDPKCCWCYIRVKPMKILVY